jgi:hypothetical protein
MKCHKCDVELKENNYYCDECASYLKQYQQKKEQTSYDDLLDALRLALKGYNIE